jgi:hypothetical protein
MRRALHAAVVALGIAIAVYGVASLTGGWLGSPPWWETTRVETSKLGASDPAPDVHFGDYDVRRVPREGRRWYSVGVVAMGLALAAVGARAGRGSRPRMHG